MSALVALAQTTTEVPRVVGEPLESWVTILAGVALLVAILVAGWLVNRRRDR